MKNILSLILLVFSIVSCGSSKETLKIFMWTGNIPQDVYDDFTKETGIKIIEDAMASNEEAYVKVKVNPASYDIVTPSFDYAEIMMKEELLAVIDKTKVPNVTNVDSNIIKCIISVDPTGEYIIPFTFGPTLIAYDKTKVSNDIRGYEIFTNSAYKGKMSLLNDMREVMGSAFLILGYKVDETNTQALQDVENLLNAWKQNILRFDADSYPLAYANEEIDIVHGYPGAIIPSLSQEKLSNTVFVTPNKGGMMWVDNLVILKDAPNKEAAMKFINFIHRPEIYARIINYLQSISLNIPAREYITTESPISYEELGRLEVLKALENETLEIHSRIWENIQAQ
ncbi:MAG: extracellular solute-binding protein [Spirochaetota bacterium]|nr:extracellular solute-binding protein [Spirochaetota bacterium]